MITMFILSLLNKINISNLFNLVFYYKYLIWFISLKLDCKFSQQLKYLKRVREDLEELHSHTEWSKEKYPPKYSYSFGTGSKNASSGEICHILSCAKANLTRLTTLLPISNKKEKLGEFFSLCIDIHTYFESFQ